MFKLPRRPISTAKAQKLRRGIVSGKIMLEHVERLTTFMPEALVCYWVAGKMEAYGHDLKSHSELMGFHYTVQKGLRRILTPEQIRQTVDLAFRIGGNQYL